MSTSAVAPAFNRRVVEIASMLSLQAPGANAHFDMLEEWGRDVALFFTWLHTKEHKEPFTLTAVSNLRTTFQDQVDTHRHLSWLSWGRLWLPLTVEASRAALRALIVELDIEDPLASPQQSPPAVATVPELSNNSKGKDRATPPAADHSPNPASPTDENDDSQDSTDSASSDDGERNKEIPARTSTPRAKRPREPSLQVDARPSNDQTHSSPASRSSKRPRLSGFRTLRLSHKGRSSGELMHHYDLRDPCEVAHKCKRCTAKPSAKPCVTILRRSTQTSQYVLSKCCLRCILEKCRCEWPAGAVVKNTERRVHVKSGHSLLTEDLSLTPKGLESVLGQSSASAHQVVSNLPHRNTVKATSSTRPAPGPSSATATKRAKHTSHSLPQLPTLKVEDDLDAIDVHACPYFKPEAIDVKIIKSPVPVEGGDEEVVGPKVVVDGEGINSEFADTGDGHVDHGRSLITSSSSSGSTSCGPEYRTTGVHVDIRVDSIDEAINIILCATDPELERSSFYDNHDHGEVKTVRRIMLDWLAPMDWRSTCNKYTDFLFNEKRCGE